MKNNQMILIAGSLIGVVLVIVLFLQNSKDGESVAIQPVFQVSGITPEVAAIRSSERVAGIQARTQTALGYFAYQLGLTQSQDSKELGILNSNNSRELGILDSNNRVVISRQESEAATRIGLAVSESQREIALAQSAAAERIADRAALSQEQIARLQTDAQRYTVAKQESTKRTGSILGTIGTVVGSILKFF